MNAIQMVREVQKALRLPQSNVITEPHAQLILRMLNLIQRDIMTESIVWDELKAYGNFQTETDVSVYGVYIEGKDETDYIRSMSIDGVELTWLTDEDFRRAKKYYTQTGKPIYYRIYSRYGENIIVELLPTPDKEYTIECEVLIKPMRLVDAEDEPALDPDTIVLGAIALAKAEQGQDASTEHAAFQSKMALQLDTRGESNWGDVEIL